MHHDKKVGLGLGILLVGIVGAFFFRNEPPKPQHDLPELLTADELDREIGQAGIERSKPYTELDDFESKYRPGVKLEGIEPPDRTQPPAVPPSAAGLFDDEFDFLNDPVTTPPEPIKPAVSAPSHSIAVSTTSGAGIPPIEREMFAPDPAKTKPARPAERAEPRIYEVQSGDTLSELASQFLGSQANYHLIFEANRDQLNSPNDLKPGMKLVIPSESDAAREPERDVTSTRVPKRVPLEAGRNSRPIEPLPAITPGPARLEETITEAPPAKQPALKFERAPRNPLNPRRSNLRDGETPPSAERSPSANKPASQPVSRQSIPESEPPAKKPDEGPKGTSPSLPSLDGLEPLPTPSP